MTATEMMKYVGCMRWYPTGGILVSCKVVDVMVQGNMVRFLLEPVEGIGRVWVDAKSLEEKDEQA